MAATPLTTEPEIFNADIELGEYESSDPIRLSETAARMLEQEVNGGEARTGERIKLKYNREGKAILTATQYVGIVSLRDGPTVQVEPKAAGTNLLYLLRYAQDTNVSTFEIQTPYREGKTFLDALGALYEAELRRVLNRGLQTDYRRKSGTEEHLRGQLDIQRQIQRQPPTPTAFECTYDELTHDTIANRSILYATYILLGLVSDPVLTQSLRQHQQLLRRRVSLKPVSVQEIKSIQLNRLSEYYSDILRLAQMVIGNVFVGEIEAGSAASFAMLMNMNTIFEKAVEKAVEKIVSEYDGWEVKPQDRTQSLLTKGKHDVTLKPDITVYDDTGSVQLVGDAKWKTDKPSNSDFYQMTSYMLARDAPGVLFYPDCNDRNATETIVADQYDLILAELSTATSVSSYDEFVESFEEDISELMNDVLSGSV